MGYLFLFGPWDGEKCVVGSKGIFGCFFLLRHIHSIPKLGWLSGGPLGRRSRVPHYSPLMQYLSGPRRNRHLRASPSS